MTQAATTQLSEDDVDDLLYFARAGETAELQRSLASLKTALRCSETEIILDGKDPYSDNNMLHMAAGNGHLETTKFILSQLPAPSSPEALPHSVVSHKNTAGNTPLHWASLNGHLPVVQALIMSANADPTLTNDAGHDVIYEAELNQKEEIVNWILSHCKDVEGGVNEDDAGPSSVAEGDMAVDR